jgi:sulfatase modifying factor 1
VIGILIVYLFTKNSTTSSIGPNENNMPRFKSEVNNLEYQRIEDSDFNEVYNNPELDNYLKFIEKYPASLKKDELIKRVINSNPNLPSEKYWHAIKKNDKDYWELSLSKANMLKLVWIPLGRMLKKSDPNKNKDQKNNIQKTDEIKTKGFWMGKYEVTVDQYKYYCDENGISFSDYSVFGDLGNGPVRNISWDEAKKYCEWLGCRLPTELEWERAVRGEMNFNNYFWGEEFDPAFCNISSSKIMEVGSFKSNNFDLYDMIGNVSEWLQDWYSEDLSGTNKQKLYKVIRGGSFKDKPDEVTLLKRYYMFPAYKGETYGFRVAMD